MGASQKKNSHALLQGVLEIQNGVYGLTRRVDSAVNWWWRIAFLCITHFD